MLTRTQPASTTSADISLGPQSHPGLSSRAKHGFVVIGSSTIHRLIHEDLAGCVQVVRDAYLAHDAGQTINPPSVFLRFPERPAARIIALPAHLRGSSGVSGIKWISSYPENTHIGLARASAVMILNETESGFPLACLEGSIISAARTAASAVLAAEYLCAHAKRIGRLGLVGCGYISRYVLEFLMGTQWDIETVHLYDTDASAAQRLVEWYASLGRRPVKFVRQPRADAVVAACDTVLFATVASTPHVVDPGVLSQSPTILHLSLRDLAPELILAANNIVDDAQHAVTAATSLALAVQQVGHSDFIGGTLADLVLGRRVRSATRANIFSPFGLGMLDLAVARWIYDRALETGETTMVQDFHPQ